MAVQKSSPSDGAPTAADIVGGGGNAMPDSPDLTGASSESSSTTGDALGLLLRHRGKLAAGAAAMLGLAAFYHWRESRLAKDDEEEFARLQRLKAALDADDGKPDRKR